jgi:hypothetical protein
MKKICSTLLATMYLLAIAGCHDNAKELTLKADPKPPPDNIKHVLSPLKTAKNDIQTFVALCKDSLGVVPVNGYTIRAEDLLDALGLPPSLVDSNFNGDTVSRHVRIYLGYRDQGSPAEVGFKLFIVPVNGANLSGNDNTWKAGRDLMLDSNGNVIKRGPQKGIEEDEYVLDLNAPCPKTCPDGSPLYIPGTAINKSR